MALQIYNTLSKKKDPFEPVVPGQVKMYSCGVTVYDECHIGHARSLYIFDVIRRYLKYKKYNVTFVRNITDIDDKIINKAKELGTTAEELAQKYTESYYRDLESLGIEKADVEPKATEHIPEMVKHIRDLIEKDYAYAVDGDVYFRVKKFKDYGKLSGQGVESMFEGVRIEQDPKKQDPLDFALWKKSKEGEPEYDSPWSKGRPGWHIECSVMSSKYLGQTFDIHAGGLDLVFPHHENEIAQSEVLTGKKFAKYWIHHGLLTINGQKMAKSLGNFVTIKDFLNKYSADVLKLFFLTTHYSNPIDFTWDIIKQKQEALYKIIRLLDDIKKAEEGTYRYTGEDSPSEIMSVEQFEKEANYIRERFEFRMDNNFDTPRAIAAIFDIVSSCYLALHGGKEYLPILKNVRETILELGSILGLRFESRSLFVPEDEIDPELAVMIEERNKAREAKDFKKADSIRKELETKGIILEDTKDGKTIPRRKS